MSLALLAFSYGLLYYVLLLRKREKEGIMRRNVQQWACLGGPCELMGLQTNPMFQYHNYFLTVVTFYTNCLLTIQKLYVSKLIVFCCLVIHSYPTYLNLVACRDVKTFQMLFSVSQLSPHLSLLTVWKVPTPQNCIFVHSIFRIRGCRKKGKLRGHFSSGNVFPFVKKKGVRETKLLLIVSGLSGLKCQGV